jgi:hypothetical protein
MFSITTFGIRAFAATWRQVMGGAFGLALAAGMLLPGSAVAQAAPEGAPADGGMVLHGCVVTTEDGGVVFRVSGAGAGPDRLVHVNTSGVSDFDPATSADACGAIVVYQQDGVWYAESVSVTRDEDGDVTVNHTSGTRPVGPRGR